MTEETGSIRSSGETTIHTLSQNPMLHTKLAASSMLPLPLYFATSGYAHNGRERVTVPV